MPSFNLSASGYPLCIFRYSPKRPGALHRNPGHPPPPLFPTPSPHRQITVVHVGHEWRSSTRDWRCRSSRERTGAFPRTRPSRGNGRALIRPKQSPRTPRRKGHAPRGPLSCARPSGPVGASFYGTTDDPGGILAFFQTPRVFPRPCKVQVVKFRKSGDVKEWCDVL